MTIYYVRKSGSDSNAGTSPAAAWLTIGKALGASGISSGDTVYIGPGVYREQVTVAMTSATAETFVIGDVTGAYTGDTPGPVRITNRTTNDTTLTASADFILDLGSKDHLTFQYLDFDSSFENTWGIVEATAGTQYITFRDCSFIVISTVGGVNTFQIAVGDANASAHWLIERCKIWAWGSMAFQINNAAVPSAALDMDFIIQNCYIVAGQGAVFTGDAANQRLGGLIVRNSFIWCDSGPCVDQTNGNTTYPTLVENNILYSNPFWNDYAIKADAANDQIVENYNYIIAANDRLNVDVGANSKDDGSYAFLVHHGQEVQGGGRIRPVGTPTSDSPLLGFGNSSDAPSVDLLNRPRPASLNGSYSMNAVGPYERHDTGTEETTVYDSPPSSMKITGPGDHDFEIPVNSLAAVNLSVMVRYNGDHGSANKPQVQVLADSVLGVNAETLTMTEAADTWERLEFSSFTPLAYGVVRLRCISRAAAGNGIAYFDSITV